jgi:hypothetical protein
MTTPRVTKVLDLLAKVKEGQSGQLFGKTVNIVDNRLEIPDE